MQCYCPQTQQQQQVSVYRADWPTDIDQFLLPGQKAKGLMEKASF
jgi:hypothetical protein